MLIKLLLLSAALAISLPGVAQQQSEAAPAAGADCPEPGRDEWRDRRGYQGGGRHAGGHLGGGHGYRGGKSGAYGAARGRGRGCGGGGGHRHWNIPAEAARRLNPVEVSPDALARGQAVYAENCQRCHGEFGFGDGPDAKDLRVRPVPLRHAARMHSDGELDYIIRSGRDPMPAWQDKLTQQQIWDVINHIRFDIGARRGPPFMQGSRESSTPGAGRERSGHDMSGHAGMHGGMGMGMHSADHGDMHDAMMQHHEGMQHDMPEHHEAMQHDDKDKDKHEHH